MPVPPAAYDRPARALHWLTAALIAALIPMGLLAASLPEETSAEILAKARLLSLHKTLGVALLAVALVRLGRAARVPRPAPLHPERRLETGLAETVHHALYLALVLVPLSGWVHHAATTGFAPILWPLPQGLPLVPVSDWLAAAAAATHASFTVVLYGALALHVAGALKHALVDRDGTLARMVSGRAGAAATRAPVPAGRGWLAGALAAGLWVGTFGAVLATLPPPPAVAVPAPVVAAAPGPEAGAVWQVESGEVSFTVRQLGAEVTGRFADWAATITYAERPDADGRHGRAEVTIASGSVRIGSVTAQALGPDFFDAAAFPEARFAADLMALPGGGHEARGTLALKGRTVPVTLPFTLTITGDVAEAAGSLTLDRRDFAIGAAQADPATLGFEVVVQVRLTARRPGV